MKKTSYIRVFFYVIVYCKITQAEPDFINKIEDAQTIKKVISIAPQAERKAYKPLTAQKHSPLSIKAPALSNKSESDSFSIENPLKRTSIEKKTIAPIDPIVAKEEPTITTTNSSKKYKQVLEDQKQIAAEKTQRRLGTYVAPEILKLKMEVAPYQKQSFKETIDYVNFRYKDILNDETIATTFVFNLLDIDPTKMDRNQLLLKESDLLYTQKAFVKKLSAATKYENISAQDLKAINSLLTELKLPEITPADCATRFFSSTGAKNLKLLTQSAINIIENVFRIAIESLSKFYTLRK